MSHRQRNIAPADFHLIPGAMQPASSFDNFVTRLEEDGHTTIVYDLPIDTLDASVDNYAAIINERIKVVDKAGKLTIVLANSRGGMTLSRVGGDVHVHVNTYVQPAIDQAHIASQAPQALDAEYQAGIVTIGEGPLTMIKDYALAKKHFWPDLSDEAAAEQFSALRPQNRSDSVPPIPTQPNLPTVVIGSKADTVILPAYTAWMAHNLLHVTPLWIEGGHLPHLERPDVLAQAVYSGIADLKQ